MQGGVAIQRHAKSNQPVSYVVGSLCSLTMYTRLLKIIARRCSGRRRWADSRLQDTPVAGQLDTEKQGWRSWTGLVVTQAANEVVGWVWCGHGDGRRLQVTQLTVRDASARQTRHVTARCNSPVGWIQTLGLDSWQHQLTVIALLDEVAAAGISRCDRERQHVHNKRIFLLLSSIRRQVTSRCAILGRSCVDRQ